MLKFYLVTKNTLSAGLAKLTKKEEGAALVEYGLLVGLIACICIAVITGVGQSVRGLFSSVNTALADANTAVGS
jgi:pilus assembly protein Flp/PilA